MNHAIGGAFPGNDRRLQLIPVPGGSRNATCEVVIVVLAPKMRSNMDRGAPTGKATDIEVARSRLSRGSMQVASAMAQPAPDVQRM